MKPDEQNIPGLPEGHKIASVRKAINRATEEEYYIAIIERIPKPKRTVLVAEWTLGSGVKSSDRINPITAVVNGVTYPAENIHLEERDA